MLSQVLRWAHEGYQGIVKINIGCEPKFGLRKCAIISDGWTYAADRSTFRTLARWSNWCPRSTSFRREHTCSSWLLRRFFDAVIMHSTTYQKMIEALTPILKRYEYQFILTHRNIPHLMWEEFENCLTKNGIQHRKSSPLSWPQAKGEVERQNH